MSGLLDHDSFFSSGPPLFFCSSRFILLSLFWFIPSPHLPCLFCSSLLFFFILHRSKRESRGRRLSPDNGDLQGELFHGFSPHRRGRGSPIFVTMPVDSVDPLGQVRRRKTMSQSFKALVAAGVEGVVMEVWWGSVERDQPTLYNWQGYLGIVEMARRYGLKVRAVLAFHQHDTGPWDSHWLVSLSFNQS